MNWLILSLLFVSKALSAESFLCLEKDQSVQTGYNYLENFLLAKDRAYANLETNCIDLSVDETRYELLNNLLAKKFKLTSFKNTDRGETSSAPQCEMQIIQSGQNDSSVKSGSVSSNVKVNAFESNSESRSVSTISGTSGEPIQFNAYGESIKITCRVMARGRFEIIVALSSQSTNSALATSINVIKGEVVNLGKLMREAKNNTKNLDIKQGIASTVGNEKIESHYDLVVK